MNIDHIHFFVEDAPRQREWFIHCLGWEAVGHRQLPDHEIEVLRYRDTLFVLTSPRTSDSPVANYLQTYAPGVVDVAIAVDNLAQFMNRPQAPQPIHTPYQEHLTLVDELRAQDGAMASTILANASSASICTAGWGRLRHTIVERPPSTSSRSLSCQPGTDRQSIDHIVLNVAKGELSTAVAFYEAVWGLEKRQQFNIQTKHSGLNSQVLCAPDTPFYFNINEPTSEASQIQTFIESNRGAGIQHIALHSDPIVPTVHALRQHGTPLLSVPPAYYRQLEHRLQRCPAFPVQALEWQHIIQQQILLDWQPDRPEALLLQIFSQPIFKDNHFFFEFIERRRAVEGFGEGNFLALYQAIEAEMRGQTDGTSLIGTPADIRLKIKTPHPDEMPVSPPLTTGAVP